MIERRVITYPRLLNRAIEVVLLVVVAATALGHPLCLPEVMLQGLYERIGNPKLFQQMLPWLSCGYSPLVLKESVLLTLAIAVFFFFTWLKVCGLWLRVETPALERRAGWRGLAARPEVWLGAFMLFCAASVFWSPTFQQSFQTWLLLCAGAGLGLLCGTVSGRRHFAVRFMLLVVLCGAVLGGAALLQHLGIAPWLSQSSDPRNRMSSLIGHNTGLSAWLLFPLSYCIYFGLTNRRIWARVFSWLLAAFFVLVIIAAESRAAWALGLLVGGGLLWKISRVMYVGKVPVSRLLLAGAVLAGLVFALSVKPRSNPLARMPVSLGERLTGHVFNLDQLRRETRLRILVVSLAELFPAAPLHGSGIGSFQWVYPKAQGEYFQAHPNSQLGTTTKRTDLAHNDYLQVLVETGLVGLVLLGGCLLTVVADLRRGYRQMSSRYDQALCWALVAPAAAVALHALVDFPMHVAPVAVLGVLSLQLARRLGQQTAYIEDKGIGTELEFEYGLSDVRQDRRATMVGLVISVMLFSWTPWAWQALVGRELLSDAYLNSGRDWLTRFYDSRGQVIQQRFALLDRARRTFRQAVVSNVFNGEAYEGQATACINRASLALQYVVSHSDDTDTTAVQAMRGIISRDAAAAVTIIYNQMASGGLRYHFSWYLLGRAWRLQWELEKGTVAAEDSKAYAQAVAALRKAVQYNPADAAALRELSDLLSQGKQTRAEGVSLLERLFKIDPYSARELIVDPALELAAEGETTTARTMLEQVFADYPKEPAVLAARAWLAFYEAVWPPAALDDVSREAEYLQWRQDHLSPALDAVAALPEDAGFSKEKSRLKLLFAAAAGELREANGIAKQMLAKEPDHMEARVIYNWTNQELFGGGMPAMDSVEYFRTSAIFAVYFMTRREQGLVWAGEVYARGGRLTLAQARRLAAFCVANEWWDVLRKTMPVVMEDYAGDEMLQEVARRAGV